MILERPEEPGKRKALTLAALVHLGLIVFLFLGVQWKRTQPDVVEVELYAPHTTQATVLPPPPPPPPETKPAPRPEPKPVLKPEARPEPSAPKKPDIAVKDEKKKPEPKKPEPKPEPPKPEPKKPEPKPEHKPEPKPEPKKLESKPEPKKTETPKFDFSKELASETSQLKSSRSTADAQRLSNAAAAESEQRASANKRGLESYVSKIRGKVRGNIVLPPGIQGNPEALVEVTQLPNGEVLDVRIKRGSGNAGLDTAIERAIRKSSPLPKPDDPALFQRVLEIKYRPFEE